MQENSQAVLLATGALPALILAMTIASMLEPIEEVTMDDFESYDSSAVDIQRKKNIQLQMMTDDEAIVQMEMLGHSFFVYLAPNGQTCVIYKRGKGYGQLICS